MFHQGQRLSLRLEARDDRTSIHAELDDFQRHAPPHRLLLFRQVNDAESALADSFEELVTTDASSGTFAGQNIDWLDRSFVPLVQRAVFGLVNAKQRLDAL